MVSEGKKLQPEKPVTLEKDDKKAIVKNSAEDMKEKDDHINGKESGEEGASAQLAREEEGNDTNEQNIDNQPKEVIGMDEDIDEDISKLELIQIPAAIYMEKLRASTHFIDEYGKANASMYLGAVESMVILFADDRDMICVNDFTPLLCQSVITPFNILFENQLICNSNAGDEEEPTPFNSLSSSLSFPQVPFNYKPGTIKLGLLSKLLKPPLSGDILPHELNRSLGAHVDLSQLAVYLNGEDEISLSVKMKKCTFKCSKITGKENVKTGAVTYETFMEEVMFLSELPQFMDTTLPNVDDVDDGVNDGPAANATSSSLFRTCDLVYQDL